MKKLIMCEGPNEVKVIDILLRHDCLKFTNDDLLGLRPYHARQIDKSAIVKTELNLYPYKVEVLRIGDSLNDALKIPKDYKNKIANVEKYCTKPEIEMLLIIAENLTAEFNKVKSKQNPKTFSKQNIKCGKRKYKNDTDFYTEYFDGDIDKLVNAIKEYKRIKKHKNDELYLADLLK